jgi:hypothetical protein
MQSARYVEQTTDGFCENVHFSLDEILSQIQMKSTNTLRSLEI